MFINLLEISLTQLFFRRFMLLDGQCCTDENTARDIITRETTLAVGRTNDIKETNIMLIPSAI